MCTLVAASLLLVPVAAASAQLVGPTAPADLAATPTAPGEIALAWSAASSLTGVTAYRVYHVGEDGALAHVVDVPSDQLSLVESGIAPGTRVTYVVSAVDALGEGPASEPASATTWTVADAPQDFVAIAGAPGTFGETTLSWSAPANDGGAAVLAYQVYRDGALVATLDAGNLTWTDAGLTPFHAYAYAVTAVNAVGEGAAATTCGMASPALPELGCTTLL